MAAMCVEWSSRRGRSRKENRDAGGIWQTAIATFALVLDVSDRGPHGVAFAEYWIGQVLKAVSSAPQPNVNEVIAAMQHVHRQARTMYPAEVAAYSGLLLRHDLSEGWALSCGDCRVGKESAPGEIEWITPVHTLANLAGDVFTLQHATMPARHTLTRTLRARKFAAPDVQPISVSQGDSWILSTDGHWIDHLFLCTPHEDLHDDASFLRLSHHGEARIESDSENWIWSAP